MGLKWLEKATGERGTTGCYSSQRNRAVGRQIVRTSSAREFGVFEHRIEALYPHKVRIQLQLPRKWTFAQTDRAFEPIYRSTAPSCRFPISSQPEDVSSDDPANASTRHSSRNRGTIMQHLGDIQLMESIVAHTCRKTFRNPCLPTHISQSLLPLN